MLVVKEGDPMNKNKLFAGLLAALLTISLSGCGNTTQTEERESSNPAPQTIHSADVTSDTESCDDITAAESKPEGSATGAESIPAEKDESAPVQAWTIVNNLDTKRRKEKRLK